MRRVLLFNAALLAIRMHLETPKPPVHGMAGRYTTAASAAICLRMLMSA